MKTAPLGSLGPVSRLTLGGGGIGQIWGETSREESVATIRAAIDGGIDLIDTAPMYGSCEAIIGETFDGALPAAGHVDDDVIAVQVILEGERADGGERVPGGHDADVAILEEVLGAHRARRGAPDERDVERAPLNVLEDTLMPAGEVESRFRRLGERAAQERRADY